MRTLEKILQTVIFVGAIATFAIYNSPKIKNEVAYLPMGVVGTSLAGLAANH